jgi:hypothetical protein
MMKSMLKLNPFFRPTAHECLISDIFNPYRNYPKEKMISEMKNARHSNDQN